MTMAKMTIDGMDELVGTLDRVESGMKRTGIRRIVEAGAQTAIDEMRTEIANHHVRHGNMRDSTGMAEYHETMDGGSANVYPQGTDSRGVRNALKAYVINYGIGGNPTIRSRKKRIPNKTGDKFITGQFSKTKLKVQDAMAAEASAFLSDVLNQGG